ncbi:dephospho-CoA kinase [Limosilactobacillus mucosae]|uniref:dephospho-CoA kinase n=1 Tax=Lactobacillaceae TaxID=33958 RepID=UPI00146B50C8|nr:MULTISPECIES: dephospho-CoA kinase [Lactobacillaceae]MDD6454682.1 dephospho-CoA kinase [Lactobacillus sp.]MDC2839850.1 dephospho-CoA kinase [Limosilactobacillus mucosae]MDC2845079.1 dephospho-CoA kinase [Limosilactobacillus mucosae]MDD6865757.1 dephospho-CoA kinase [Lactobacillus sp.]MDF9444975.1 dephospho-CoA kinase [Limosilactobacillus mucosae]
MTLVIGLTGGIASGKSTISSILKAVGWPVIDADLIARQIVMPGSKGLEQIVNRFGPQMLNSDGTLDRKKLGKTVFDDPKKLSDLDKIEHPLIQEAIDSQLDEFKKQHLPVVVLDVPLLFETGMDEECDLTVLAVVDQATQLKRLMKRDQISKMDAVKKISSQMSLKEKMQRADVIIDNNGTLEQTRSQVAELVDRVSQHQLL